MSAILFMLRKSLKNALLDLVHHPLKLIVYLLVIGLLLFSGISSLFIGDIDTPLLDIRLLHGIYLGVLLLISLPTLLLGMKSGANFFSMSDVNLLFVAPISPKKILLYGLMKQMGATLLVCFFLLAYGGMAVDRFGISIPMALLLLLGLAASLFCAQLLTMLIYSFVNGNRTRIRAVKYALYALILAVIAYLGVTLYRAGLSLESVAAAISSPVLEFIPLVGWIKGLLFAVMVGEPLRALLFGGLLAAGIGLLLFLFIRVDADYYEDVLQNAETTYAVKEAAKSGDISAAMNMPNMKMRVKDTGLNGGWGPSAFFFKHLREIRRRSRLIFLSGSSLMLLAICVVMSVIFSRISDDGERMPANIAMMVVAMMGVYFQFFLSATGEWSRELTRPYLFLVPASPFLKLLLASLSSLLKPFVEGLLVYVVCAVIVGAGPLVTVFCLLLYVTFGWVFTASSLLSERLLGRMSNRSLIMVAYMLLLLVLIAPGIILGVVLGVAVPGISKVFMALPVILWNTLLALGCYALCRNTLHDMEVT